MGRMTLLKAFESGLQASNSFPTEPVGRGLITREDRLVQILIISFFLASLVLYIAKISEKSSAPCNQEQTYQMWKEKLEQ